MEEKLRTIKEEAHTEITQSQSETILREIEIKYLGRNGILTSILRNVKDLKPEDKPIVGKLGNEIKIYIANLIEEQSKKLQNKKFAEQEKEWIDISAYTLEPKITGHLNPLTSLQYELEDIFKNMGFHVWEGPYLEKEEYNFTALNIPQDHPARDMQDTFWIDKNHVLRTHTSPVQIRAMQSLKPPFRVIVPGRVFRYEATDASHENTFYQLEGLMIDKNISISHLIYTMKTFLSAILHKDIEIRLRPGYFPFVEPGLELEISCIFCDKKGCSICKHGGFIELMGCGLVHPDVLKYVNIDPEVFSGFAFGMGLERLVMLKHRINDIRYFLGGDLRFVTQF